MKAPWSPKLRSASFAELQNQLEQAKVACADAQAATTRAQSAFDDVGDQASEKALTMARAAEQSALEHLGRAQRLGAEAEVRRKAEHRTELESKAAEYAATLADGDPIESALVREEAEHYQRAAAVRAKRRANALSREQLRGTLHAVQVELGRASADQFRFSRDVVEPSHHLVARLLEEAARQVPADDARRTYLSILAAINFRGHS